MSEQHVNTFYRQYNLPRARQHLNGLGARQPGHQRAALEKLYSWFAAAVAERRGGMLVLPTGGGKTFTAARFLCAGPLSRGYKVLTIIFADRWFQCEQLREFLAQRGVRVGTVYSRVDATPGTVEARNRRDAGENKQTLEQFKRGGLDVLINVTD